MGCCRISVTFFLNNKHPLAFKFLYLFYFNILDIKMVEQMVNPQYEFMEQYFASLCEVSGGSGQLIFHEKETGHVKSWCKNF